MLRRTISHLYLQFHNFHSWKQSKHLHTATFHLCRVDHCHEVRIIIVFQKSKKKFSAAFVGWYWFIIPFSEFGTFPKKMWDLVQTVVPEVNLFIVKVLRVA